MAECPLRGHLGKSDQLIDEAAYLTDRCDHVMTVTLPSMGRPSGTESNKNYVEFACIES